MRLRHATPQDAAAIAAIYNHAVMNTTASFDTIPKSIEDRASWLTGRHERHPVIVAEDGDAIAGWGALSPYSERPAYDATVEISVYVAESHHRLGIGSAITRELLALAPSVGLHVILARICTENVSSIRMVESLGFAEAGTMHEVGRKFDRWLDVVTWEYRVGAQEDADWGHST
jgi:phosphinothricin acetyltransferase